MQILRRPTAIAVVASLAIVGPALGQALPVDAVPPELKPWIPWVLDEARDHVCPITAVAAEQHIVCVWPGRLALALDGHGGAFTQSVVADREIPFALPGDEAHWPQGVTLNGKPVPVIEKNSRPQIVVPAGTSHVAGRLEWLTLPESIHIPATTALVDLAIAGAPVPFPRRDAEGLLWLQAGEGPAGEGERLDLDVVRRISDGVPLFVTTRIILRVAGKAREANLGKILLDGTIPVSVTGDLPARLEPAGGLRAQLRAGTFTIEVIARASGSPTTLSPPALPLPWPSSETWVWEANESLRQVSVAGALGVDPSRTSLPAAWRKLPAYEVTPETKLTLTTTRRGVPDPPPDRLSLSRQIWMDVDGLGFTFRDRLSGTLSRTWRLDLEADGTLGHVAVSGVDQLITADPASHRPGVELRDATLNVLAEWRASSVDRSLPAVGWSEDVQGLDAVLHLPPGWRLVTATGVDSVPGTMLGRWNLLGFFFVFVVAAAIGRLTRWWWGAIALVTLALCYPEPGAPLKVWFSLLAAAALARVLPQGLMSKAVRVWWWGSVAALILVVIPFTVDELRTGMFPQVQEHEEAERPWGSAGEQVQMQITNEVAVEKAPMPVQADEPAAPILEADISKTKVKREATETDARQLQNAQGELALGKGGNMYKKESYGANRRALQNDPNAVVQTGFGIPAWSWHSYHVSWSGPVSKDHRIHLWILSPLENLILGFLRAILLVLVAIRLAWGESKRPWAPRPGPVAAAASLLVAGFVVLSSGTARADVPSDEILAALKDRLTRAEVCRPSCVSNSTLDLRVVAGQLALTAEVHVGAPSSWRIPGPAESWVPRTVTIDGLPTDALALLEDGFLHVRLTPGRHVVEASGPAPASDTITLQLGGAPHRMTAQAPGWKVDGLTEEGRAGSSIQLSRELREGSAKIAEAGYPPWLQVTRTLDIGIPWLIQTTVTRVSPAGSPVVARVPLLPGESVTDSGLRVENGEVIVSLGRDDTEISWSSALAEAPTLTLTAAEGRPWSEVWVLGCSPVWHCRAEGLSPVQHQDGNRWQPSFRPWPGEKLVLGFQRPDGVPGHSTTIDRAQLDVTPGARMTTAVLTLDIRSSQGGVERVTLPQGAEIQELTVNGNRAPIRQEGNTLVLSLGTGLQVVLLSWQETKGLATVATAPRVDLGQEAVNARVVMHLPHERWLIYVGGPSWGPAVLHWSYLAACLLAALVCGAFRRSPLRTWQWALLAIGLAQIPAEAAAIVVAWFFLVEWRRGNPSPTALLHDARQVGLVLWTVAALGCLYAAIHDGLLTVPDMQVAGSGSSATELVWYVDRLAGALPTPWVVSLPLWTWKGLMLAWSLWLAASLIRWLPWAWRSFATGELWRPLRWKLRKPPAPAPPNPS